MKRIEISIDDNEYNKLAAIAEQEDRSIRSLHRLILRNYLKDKEITSLPSETKQPEPPKKEKIAPQTQIVLNPNDIIPLSQTAYKAVKLYEDQYIRKGKGYIFRFKDNSFYTEQTSLVIDGVPINFKSATGVFRPPDVFVDK